MTAVYKLNRNLPLEKYYHGRPQPFAPLYDVEEIDADRFPLRTVAIGLGAEAARDVINRLGGVEEVDG